MTPEISYPENVARFYDVIYAHLRTVDRDYFLRKIEEVDGPVLEIGVGTGRFFVDALSKGADIYGIDVSPTILSQLYQKLDKKHHHRVVQQDARSLDLQRKFELIIAPFRVFSHITTAQDQLEALNQVYEHLRPGGQFIFDLYVPDLSILLNGITDQVDFDGEYAPGKRLTRRVSAHSDLINQVSHITMTLQWEEDGGTKTELWKMQMRYFFRYELEHLVHRSKLSLRSIYGDYNEGALGPESKDFIVVCQRNS
jgi:SAM-dependent methyltransferase